MQHKETRKSFPAGSSLSRQHQEFSYALSPSRTFERRHVDDIFDADRKRQNRQSQDQRDAEKFERRPLQTALKTWPTRRP